jgi:hypothetical protein
MANLLIVPSLPSYLERESEGEARIRDVIAEVVVVFLGFMSTFAGSGSIDTAG